MSRQSNVVLCRRFGVSEDAPDRAKLLSALQELFTENSPHLKEGDYIEHAEAFLSYGHDNPGCEPYRWTVYTVSIFRDGTASFMKMLDQDDDEAEYELRMDNVSIELGLNLWTLLSDGNTDAVREMFESRGEE
jgi:hypothetical protein